MAGASVSGWPAGSAALLHRAAWVVVTDDTDDADLWSDVAGLALDCGAHVVPASVDEHDAAVGRVSHLPHLMAAVLASVGADGGPLAMALAAGSFRDGTRVAGSRPELVRAMCEGNRDGLLAALDDALGQLGAARGSLASTGSLGATLTRATSSRQAYDQLGSAERDKPVIRLDAPDAMAELAELGRRGGRVVQLDGRTALAEVPGRGESRVGNDPAGFVVWRNNVDQWSVAGWPWCSPAWCWSAVRWSRCGWRAACRTWRATPPPPPLPTVIRSYSAQGVLAPKPGAPPAAPGRLVITPGPRRLQVTWGAAAGVVGYDVHWDGGDRLVAEPDVELDGLPPGQDVTVDVRSVDAFGQRSSAVTADARPRPDGPAGADDAFVDHFTGATVPDPRWWRLASVNNCATASQGADGRLMVLSECARSSVTLRARTPLRLNRSGTELGRFTIDTDAPGESGELDVDLVPGQVAMVDGSPNDTLQAGPPNVAVADADLPPGTVRVRVGASIDLATGTPAETVQVAAGAGVPTVPPSTEAPHAIPVPLTGMSVRWDVVLRTDGIQVLRDGVYVGGGNVVPSWSEATALVEFGGDVGRRSSATTSA